MAIDSSLRLYTIFTHICTKISIQNDGTLSRSVIIRCRSLAKRGKFVEELGCWKGYFCLQSFSCRLLELIYGLMFAEVQNNNVFAFLC